MSEAATRTRPISVHLNSMGPWKKYTAAAALVTALLSVPTTVAAVGWKVWTVASELGAALQSGEEAKAGLEKHEAAALDRHKETTAAFKAAVDTLVAIDKSLAVIDSEVARNAEDIKELERAARRR